jgi:CheY-like chemotaxis protein
MGKAEKSGNDRSIWRSAGQLAVSVEDRFRFTLVVAFIGLGLLGSGLLFQMTNRQAYQFSLEAADLAVNRWYNATSGRYDQVLNPNFNSAPGEVAPALLESNRIMLKQLLPEHLTRGELSFAKQVNGEHFWIVNQHPLIEKGTSLVLGEQYYPELRIARVAFDFQRWLVGTLLLILLGACTAFYLFNKRFVFRPMHILREALLNRRLSEVARVKQQKSKIRIERLEEKSRFPLEQFDSDEFGQIALILEDQDRRQKAFRQHWLKSFNTINEPIAVFSGNGRLRHINSAMEQFLDELGLSPDLVESMTAQGFVSAFLQMDEEIAQKIEQVVNQAYPRICSQPCSVETPEGNRAFRYSISTIANHGERFAVFSLVREQTSLRGNTIEDVILEQCNNQLKTIHRIQHTLRNQIQGRDESIAHHCESLIDNIHNLLEFSNSINPSLASHKVEFNLRHFFREVQSSMEGLLKLQVDFSHSLPNFVVGDPTHLRQFLKGIFQSCQESNSCESLLIDVSYNSTEKNLLVSICSVDGSAILRDPALGLFVQHYFPFLSLKNIPEEELQPYEFLRVSIAAPAGANRVENLDLDLSKRQLPSKLYMVSDELIPDNVQDVITDLHQVECEWLTPSEFIEKNPEEKNSCLLLFITNSQKLKEKQIQKVINHGRSSKIPAILLSQQPRRGESITALRLGFVTYLTLPMQQEEFLKLLILTMNKSVRESVGKLGLLTKHTVRDIVPSLGKVLFGNISKEHRNTGNILQKTLHGLGFSTTEATTVHGFFELLHKGNYEYVICPEDLTTGLQRRIQVGLKGIPCLVFGEQNSNTETSSKDNRQNATPVPWLKIDNPENDQAVRNALDAANTYEAERAEFKFSAEDDNGEPSDQEKDPYDLAI